MSKHTKFSWRDFVLKRNAGPNRKLLVFGICSLVKNRNYCNCLLWAPKWPLESSERNTRRSRSREDETWRSFSGRFGLSIFERELSRKWPPSVPPTLASPNGVQMTHAVVTTVSLLGKIHTPKTNKFRVGFAVRPESGIATNFIFCQKWCYDLETLFMHV